MLNLLIALLFGACVGNQFVRPNTCYPGYNSHQSIIRMGLILDEEFIFQVLQEYSDSSKFGVPLTYILSKTSTTCDEKMCKLAGGRCNIHGNGCRGLDNVEVHGLTDSEKNTVSTYIDKMFAVTNSILNAQFDISVEITALLWPGDSRISNLAIKGCSTDIQARLNGMIDWKENTSNVNESGWLLLSGCYIPTNEEGAMVGISMLNGLCQNKNVGVASFLKDGESHLTITHELGHFIGAKHTMEKTSENEFESGIMASLGNFHYNGLVQFNPLRFPEVCAFMSGIIQQEPGCFNQGKKSSTSEGTVIISTTRPTEKSNSISSTASSEDTVPNTFVRPKECYNAYGTKKYNIDFGFIVDEEFIHQVLYEQAVLGSADVYGLPPTWVVGQQCDVKCTDLGGFCASNGACKSLDVNRWIIKPESKQIVTEYIKEQLMLVNEVLIGQFDIELILERTIWPNSSEVGTLDLSHQKCSARSIDNYLKDLGKWSDNFTMKPLGGYMLLTGCYQNSSVIGFSYVGKICRSKSVGIASFRLENKTWMPLLHEFGHFLGAGHTMEDANESTPKRDPVGGIMETGGSFKYNNLVQFSPFRFKEICSTIVQRLQAADNCFNEDVPQPTETGSTGKSASDSTMKGTEQVEVTTKEPREATNSESSEDNFDESGEDNVDQSDEDNFDQSGEDNFDQSGIAVESESQLGASDSTVVDTDNTLVESHSCVTSIFIGMLINVFY